MFPVLCSGWGEELVLLAEVSEDEERGGFRETWKLTLSTLKREGCDSHMNYTGLLFFLSPNLSCPIDEMFFAFSEDSWMSKAVLDFCVSRPCVSIIFIFSIGNKKLWLRGCFDCLVSNRFVFTFFFSLFFFPLPSKEWSIYNQILYRALTPDKEKSFWCN